MLPPRTSNLMGTPMTRSWRQWRYGSSAQTSPEVRIVRGPPSHPKKGLVKYVRARHDQHSNELGFIFNFLYIFLFVCRTLRVISDEFENWNVLIHILVELLTLRTSLTEK